MPIDSSPIWQSLQRHQQAMAKSHLRELFAEDSQRFQHFSLEAAGLFLDYSKNRINAQTISLLCQLADRAQLAEQITALFNGESCNQSEQRAALHTALRAPLQQRIIVNQADVIPEINTSLNKMRDLVEKIHTGSWQGYTGKRIKHIVHFGIGGSFLGPKIVCEALRPYWQHKVQCHFIANIDSSHFHAVKQRLDPATTLFIVASKSFNTLETILNAQAAREWLLQAGVTSQQLQQHFVAISANSKAAQEFGIAPQNIFPVWDWVGGRYSLWSAIGLPIALALGMENFLALLAGAQTMDQHFRTAPFAENMPVLLALLSLWYINFFGIQAHAVMPYDHSLRAFPAYLQQLDMESNGKSVSQKGDAIAYNTGAIIWGGEGANGQHAYHQLLHQGSYSSTVDFIVPIKAHYPLNQHQAWLYASCLSQSQALMLGKTLSEAQQELHQQGLNTAEVERLAPHKVIPGNRPSNTLILEQVTPRTVGALMALYEHRVFVQAAIWNINPFDQWGVELGKQLSKPIFSQLTTNSVLPSQDSSTQGLIQRYQNRS